MLEKLREAIRSLTGLIERKDEGREKDEMIRIRDLLQEIERDVMKKELETALKALEKFDSDRKFFYLIGKLYVEVSKEEARKLIEEELKAFER